MASTPVELTDALLPRINAADAAGNLSAQAHARNVLFEVRETPENFPAFDENLDERVTALAYTLLHVGCTAAETGNKAASSDTLTRAATLLQYSYGFDTSGKAYVPLQLLVAALSYYAAGQYSRAFVLVRSSELDSPAGKIIAAFLRKDFRKLVRQLNTVLLNRDFNDVAVAESAAAAGDSDIAIDRVLTTFVAKAVSLFLEFVFSGDGEFMLEGRRWLDDGGEVARSAEAASWWWVFRLLSLVGDDLSAASPWVVLPKLYPPAVKRTFQAYLQLLPFLRPPVAELWTSQREALPIVADVTNRGAAVSLRTSGGKTRLAEIASVAALTEDPSAKVLYIAPFRSLAVEIERGFRRSLEPLGYNVSHLYGGSRAGALDTELLEDSNMIIATPEKLRALTRCSSSCITGVKLIIVDEGHLLGLQERFVRNELFIDHLRAMTRRTGARILLLSAVLPNVGEVAQWITGDSKNVGVSAWKPAGERAGLLLWNGTRVRLEWRGKFESFNPSFVVAEAAPASRKRAFPADKRGAVAATAARLSQTGPVLIFAGLAVSVPKYAQAVLQALGPTDPFEWPAHEWSVFKATCSEYYDEEAIEVKAASQGVICHHARLPGEVRLAIEHLMTAKAPRVVIATTTLAQGVNFGFTSVIMANVWVNRSPLSVRDFWNIAGRAGRAFVDTEGKVLFAVDETEAAWKVRRNKGLAEKYFRSENVEQVDSGLLKLLQLVKDTADSAGVPFPKLLEMAAEDKFGPSEQLAPLDELFDLIDDELLALYEEVSANLTEGDPAAAVDELLRTSLAAIQAQRPNAVLDEAGTVQLLKTRITRALRQFSKPEDVRAAVCSGFPLRAALILKQHLARIEALMQRYITEGRERTSLVEVIRWFEGLAKELPSVAGDVPSDTDLDLVRNDWIDGVPLRILSARTKEAKEITGDFYGYALPWIIHACGQQLRSLGNDELADELDKVSLMVELGLPSRSSAKIYLCGVKSRASAVQIAARLRNVEDSALRQLRLFLTSEEVRSRLKPFVDELAQRWLDILDAEERTRAQVAHNVPDFRLTAPTEITRLHVRELNGGYFLSSVDSGYTYPTQTTTEFPFHLVANNPRYVFDRVAGTPDNWRLNIRDPQLAAVQKPSEISII